MFHINVFRPRQGWSTIRALLVESFFNEDDTTEARKCTRSSEKKLTESTSIRLNVLDVDARETLSNGIGWFISSEDTLSRCANVGSIGYKLICEFQKKKNLQKKKQYKITKLNQNKIRQVTRAVAVMNPNEQSLYPKLLMYVWESSTNIITIFLI